MSDDTDGLFPRTASYDNAEFPPPRDFQVLARRKLGAGFKAGHQKQLLVAPVGSGKTYCALRLIHMSLLKKKRALFICDRTTLIEQTSARADEYGLKDHAIVQANHWRRDNSMPFQICSIQTLQARKYWPHADVIIIDEAHSQYTETVNKLKETKAAVVGLTATPCAVGLGLSYSNMVNAATMYELTEKGILAPMRIQSCQKPDMKGAATDSDGEWSKKAASEREAEIIGDVPAEWLKYGENRKTIAFGADIAYCKLLMERFVNVGVRAEMFTSETNAQDRADLLKEFRKPDSNIRILVSVAALSKGFDVQDIGCVIDARPLRKSLSEFVQMVGRGLRSSPDTGKKDCLLLDFSGNIVRFLQDFTDIYFNGFTSLDTSEKLDQKVRKEPEYEPKGCPSCGHKPFHRRCMACGYEKQTLALEDTAAGEMREIYIGKAKAAKDSYHLWCQLATYAKKGPNPSTQCGHASHLYHDITGEWPLSKWKRDFDFTPYAPLTKAVSGKIKSRMIAYRKSKRNHPSENPSP